MRKQNQFVLKLTLSALLAAVYALLTIALPVPQFGPVQVRFAEALTVLPFLIPASVPGLAAGCFLSNLFSPFPLDMVFGTVATVLACVLTMKMPARLLAPLPPVICNGLIVGFECAWTQVGLTAAFWPTYALNALTIGLGELCACYLLGLPLLDALCTLPEFGRLVPPGRQAMMERLRRRRK